MKIKLLSLLLFVYTTTSFALSCPSIEDIKHSKLLVGEWLPLYTSNEELASMKDIAAFRQAVNRFQHAEWSKQYAEHGHCFYQGHSKIMSRMVLAHDAFKPDSSIDWHWIESDKTASCDASIERCKFLQ